MDVITVIIVVFMGTIIGILVCYAAEKFLDYLGRVDLMNIFLLVKPIANFRYKRYLKSEQFVFDKLADRTKNVRDFWWRS